MTAQTSRNSAQDDSGGKVHILRRNIMGHSFISIQPQRLGWQEPEPSHVTGMALADCILGKFLGVVCMGHCKEKKKFI